MKEKGGNKKSFNWRECGLKQSKEEHNSIDAIDSPAVVWVPQKGTQPHLSLWRKNEDVHLHVKYVLHHTRDTSTHFPRQPKNQNSYSTFSNQSSTMSRLLSDLLRACNFQRTKTQTTHTRKPRRRGSFVIAHSNPIFCVSLEMTRFSPCNFLV